MSIYISLASIYDPELPFTLEEAYQKADSPNDIYIGVAYTFLDRTPKEMQERLLSRVKTVCDKYPNITLKIYYGEEHAGLGKGRNYAASLYNNQDYFLQIDPHTMFDYGWDTQILDLYSMALEETKNEKTVLTSYLGAYWHTNSSGRIMSDNTSWYPFQLNGSRFENPSLVTEFKTLDTNVPRYQSKRLNEFNIEYDQTKIIFPCTKFNAQFAFGNKHFALDRGLPEDVFFWEEELIQSVELLDKGFALAFPNVKLKFMHLYTKNYDLDDAYNGDDGYLGREIPMAHNKESIFTIRDKYSSYIDNPDNDEKIKKWERYSGFSRYPVEQDIENIPKSFTIS
jgi:hypothetical protein